MSESVTVLQNVISIVSMVSNNTEKIAFPIADFRRVN